MKKFEVAGVIGEGAYGVVLRCRNRETHKELAIKKFRDSDGDEATKKTAVREVKILRMLRQDNIVHLHEAFRRNGKLYLVFELMPKNLLEVLQEQPGGLPLPLAYSYVSQLVLAVEWCHSHHVVHRDIKPDNILIDPQRRLLKLCDFGFARLLPATPMHSISATTQHEPMTDYVATRWYRSPELLVGLPYRFEVDVWAIGCIMGELVAGKPLFPGSSDVDQLNVIGNVIGPFTGKYREAFLLNPLYTGQQFPDITAVGLRKKLPSLGTIAMDFIRGVLELDAANRLTSEQCCDHELFDCLAEGAPIGVEGGEAPSRSAGMPDHVWTALSVRNSPTPDLHGPRVFGHSMCHGRSGGDGRSVRVEAGGDSQPHHNLLGAKTLRHHRTAERHAVPFSAAILPRSRYPSYRHVNGVSARSLAPEPERQRWPIFDRRWGRSSGASARAGLSGRLGSRHSNAASSAISAATAPVGNTFSLTAGKKAAAMIRDRAAASSPALIPTTDRLHKDLRHGGLARYDRQRLPARRPSANGSLPPLWAGD